MLLVRRMSSLAPVCREVQVPVPWGVIAAKHWTLPHHSPETLTNWVTLHGWLDNAGSFDTLAPLLLSASPAQSLLCLDYPGHGLSSHLPPGQAYHYLEALRYIKLVVGHLGLNKFGLLGHSMGAGMSSLFAATYPEMVSALVMIDLVKPVGRKTESVIDRTRQSVENQLSIEKKLLTSGNRVYKSEDEALAKLLEDATRMQGEGAVTEESARVMLRRGMRWCEEKEGFLFTRDLRHRAMSLYGFPEEYLQIFAKAIKCPHLLIKASGSPHYEDEEEINRFLDIYKKNDKFEMVTVDGSHHVHLNNPERVVPAIVKFIDKNNLSKI